MLKIVAGSEIIGVIKWWLLYDYGLTLGDYDYALIWFEIRQVNSQNWSLETNSLRL